MKKKLWGRAVPPLPEAAEQKILELAAEGKTSREIAKLVELPGDALLTEKRVHRLLLKRRAQRSDIARAVTQEKLASHVTADLDRLEFFLVQISQKAATIPWPKAARTWIEFKKLEAQILDRKLHYAGAGGDDDARSGRGLAHLFAAIERADAGRPPAVA